MKARSHSVRPQTNKSRPSHARPISHTTKNVKTQRSGHNVMNKQHRLMSDQATDSTKPTKKAIRVVSAMYDTTGVPTDVMYLKETLIHDPSDIMPDTKVFVKTLASPINPADINLVEGTYGLPSNPPAIGGNEGLFEVVAAGPNSKFKPGDWALPVFPGYGTWRSHILGDTIDFMKVPKVNASPIDIATVAVNPCTAYRMLEDFVELKKDDVIIQNGANSSVGRMIIQLARIQGIKSINIVRSRDDIDDLKNELKGLGATVVLTEDEIKNREYVNNIFGEAGIASRTAKLGINCVGGTAVIDLSRQMANDATIVTYGGMSKKPLMVGTGNLIFNNLSYKGFWMTRWNQQHPPTDPERLAMMTKLFALIENGELKQSHDVRKITNTRDLIQAVNDATQPKKKAKVVLDWSEFHH